MCLKTTQVSWYGQADASSLIGQLAFENSCMQKNSRKWIFLFKKKTIFLGLFKMMKKIDIFHHFFLGIIHGDNQRYTMRYTPIRGAPWKAILPVALPDFSAEKIPILVNTKIPDF